MMEEIVHKKVSPISVDVIETINTSDEDDQLSISNISFKSGKPIFIKFDTY